MTTDVKRKPLPQPIIQESSPADRIFSASQTVAETVEFITPEKAADYLAKNFSENRNLIRSLVKKFAHDMEYGHWYPELGDPIRFNEQGLLIDGQHRLKALTLAGVTLQMRVQRGIPMDAVHAIDTGSSRRPGDMLKIAGFKEGPMMAASLRGLLSLKKGPLTATDRHHFTHSDFLEAAERHKALESSCTQVNTQRGIRPSVVALIHYLGTEFLDKAEEADAYLRVFNTGIPFYEGDPAQILRERFLRDRGMGVRMTQAYALMGMVHVWNHFARREPLQQIKIPKAVTMTGLDTRKL